MLGFGKSGHIYTVSTPLFTTFNQASANEESSSPMQDKQATTYISEAKMQRNQIELS